MKPGRWRNVILVVAAMALSLPLNLLGPLRPIRALAYTWDASVDTSHVPATWFTQTSPGFDITLTNPGTATWLAGGPIPVHFSVYFSPQNRDTVNDCVGGLGTCRYALPADVPAGGFATIHGQKATPFDVATYTLDLDLVREGLFWFETQTPNLPVSVGFQVKVACGSFCTTVVNSGTTQYWRLNDHQNGAGPYRHFMGATDAVVIAGYAATTTDGRLPADADAGSASLHVAPVFQAEPNNNSLNIPAGVSGFPDTAVMALGGWVKQDSDQAGHGACFIEGSPVNGTGWLCRDTAGNVSFSLDVLGSTHDHFFVASGGAVLDGGRWHYVLGRYQDGANAESELWVDGSLVATAAKPVGGECTGSEPVKAIREVYIGQNFHGFFSEVAYWQNSLSISYIGPLASLPVGGALTAAQAAGGGVNATCPCLAIDIVHGNVTPVPIDT